MDQTGRILLLKRKNEPASNQWWFPGGRVLFNELRSQAARFKVVVDSRGVLALDEQSHEARWDSTQNWVQTGLEPMMLEGISTVFPK